MEALRIGWATADLTPGEPVELTGQFHLRISEGVRDPITTTVLALDDGNDHVVMVSCDVVGIPPTLARMVRERCAQLAPGLHPMNVIMSATHTHTGPEVRVGDDHRISGYAFSCTGKCVDVLCMPPEDYVAWAAERIARAVAQAWEQRAPGSLAYGLGQAVVGRNRLSCYSEGVHRMYGPTCDESFLHIEGYEDHDVNVLATWNEAGDLSGLLINVACPSQETEHLFELSADFWHETRQELRQRHGAELPILAQCSAAGDQSPHIQYNKGAEARMRRLAGRTERQEIAARITTAVEQVLPLIAQDKKTALPIQHRVALLEVPGNALTQADVDAAEEKAAQRLANYERLLAELETNPELREVPRWYVDITREFRAAMWSKGVGRRFASQAESPTFTSELHCVRIGEMALVSNPHEYYLDYGIRIKARSKAEQTFIVQLAGWGTYVPSRRALAGNSYGATPASNPIGPEGGDMMAAWAIATIAELFAD